MIALSITATALFAAAIGVISVGFGVVVYLVARWLGVLIKDFFSVLRESRRLGRALKEARLRKLAEDVMES